MEIKDVRCELCNSEIDYDEVEVGGFTATTAEYEYVPTRCLNSNCEYAEGFPFDAFNGLSIEPGRA